MRGPPQSLDDDSAVMLRAKSQAVALQLQSAREGIAALRRHVSEKYVVPDAAAAEEEEEVIDSDHASRKELAKAAKAARRKASKLQKQLGASKLALAAQDAALSKLDLRCAAQAEELSDLHRRVESSTPAAMARGSRRGSGGVLALARLRAAAQATDVTIDEVDTDAEAAASDFSMFSPATDGEEGGGFNGDADAEVEVEDDVDIDEEALVRAIWQTQMANKVGIVSSRSFATPAKLQPPPTGGGAVATASYYASQPGLVSLARSWFPSSTASAPTGERT